MSIEIFSETTTTKVFNRSSFYIGFFCRSILALLWCYLHPTMAQEPVIVNVYDMVYFVESLMRCIMRFCSSIG